MSNNSINILIKKIKNQRPALNKKVNKGERILERNEKKLRIFKKMKRGIDDLIKLYKNSKKNVNFYRGELNTTYLEKERKLLIGEIGIVEKKLEMVRDELRLAKVTKYRIDDFMSKPRNVTKYRNLIENFNRDIRNLKL
jgi:predicted DNA-binding protein YlxM (UPF0122 family)